MAKFSKREFYEHCGVSKSYFYQYVKRGKLHVGADGLIDTALPMNQEFMDSRVKNKKTAPAPTPAPQPAAPVEPAFVPAPPKSKPKKMTLKEKKELLRLEKEVEIEAQAATHKFNLDKAIKEAELEKKEQEIELNKLKIAKLSGEVIPTDLVKVIFAQHFKSVTTAFHQGCDNFIMTIAKVTGMKRAEMATMRGELIEIVNHAVTDGIDESRQSLKHIVGEYKEKRGVGEKK
jgi:hypothetical protein